LTIIGVIFSGGVAWSVFMGANATDDEVKAAVHDGMAGHNGGTHPGEIDPKTHRPVGDHPELRHAVESNTGAIEDVSKAVDDIKQGQTRLDKRSEYQFELGRWQSAVMEAERQRRKRPAKPERLKQLESDLMLGNYSG
jgi:hypothetical protein